MRNPFKREPQPAEKSTLQERTAALKGSMARLLNGRHRVDLTDQPSPASLLYDLAEQIAPLPVHTLAGMHVKLRLAAFYWTCLPRGPHEDEHNGEIAIRSLYRSTPGIVLGVGPFGVRIVPEVDPTPAAEPDPHLAYRDRLIVGIVERWTARPIENAKPSEIEKRAHHLVWTRLNGLIQEVSALPPPRTPQGLGVLAMAAAAQLEGAIGLEGDFRDERMAANLVRGVLATTGTQLPPVFIGFGDEPDFVAREDVAFSGLYALPGWALTAAAEA